MKHSTEMKIRTANFHSQSKIYFRRDVFNFSMALVYAYTKQTLGDSPCVPVYILIEFAWLAAHSHPQTIQAI